MKVPVLSSLILFHARQAGGGYHSLLPSGGGPQETIRFIEAKESGKRSAGRMHYNPATVPTSVDAASSTYKRNERRRFQGRLPDRRISSQTCPCSHCSKTGHGSGRQERMNLCPAFNHTCVNCNLPHHFESVCRTTKQKQKLPANQNDSATPVFQSLCPIESEEEYLTSAVTLDHHIYDSLGDTWYKRASAPQPTISVKVQAVPLDAESLRIETTVKKPTRSTTIPAVADTGCQSCLAGTPLLRHLGLNISHLIPTSMRMRAANQNAIVIVGALVLWLTATTESGQAMTTRQIVYFTHSTDKFFLSLEACKDLGIVPKTFPHVESDMIDASPPHSDDTEKIPEENYCDCPPRQNPPSIPTALPFPATEENREKLEQWLLDYYKGSTFNICQHQILPMMSGPPMRLLIEDDATPVAYHNLIPVPIHWQEQVKAGLDQDVRLGVIEPVPVGTPVSWCHKMVVCAKKSGKPRRTVDFQALNRYAARETHHTQSPFHQARMVPANTRKTTFDAWNGYHSITLDPKDRHLTTFITPWGRYRYCVCPQGYIASGDAYTRRFDEIVSDIKNKTKVIDDTIMWSGSINDSFFQAAKWLDICCRNGIILNPSKFEFAKNTVAFTGFEITPTSVRQCPQVIEAIKEFPKPPNITDVRSWFGLINQVVYTFASADRMKPFRNLLKPNSVFKWTDNINTLFEETKVIIVQEIQKGVEIFDKRRPTCLATDFSKEGIRF